MRYISPIKALLPAVCAILLIACNKKSDFETYQDQSTLAVTGFSLKIDHLNVGLDSAYFAIDLNQGVIYNPDSLKPGTPINKLVPVISYSNDVETATLTMTGGTTRQGDVDYKAHPTDSIDFTGNVTLTLTRGIYSRTYRLKVNVHKEYADSLRWDEAARTSLPSRMANPLRQKTVTLPDSTALSLIQENDGSYTLASSSDLYANRWSTKAVTLPFTPRVETFASAEGKLFLLDTDGNLFEGNTDGNWQATGQVWTAMIGDYLESVVGLRTKEGKTVFAQYPQVNLVEKTIPDDFPVSGFSNFVTLHNKWTLSPVAFFMGGMRADGTLSPATWAFDGAEWIRLNDADLPPMEQASIIPYYYYRSTTSAGSLQEYRVWMITGGRLADNRINRTVYMTYDSGVNWRRGATSLQLPEAIPDMWGCDNVVAASPKSSDISANWKVAFRRNRPARLPYEVDGNIIRWECPYIYLIGGTDANGKLCNTIWRGVLNRLTFVPII